MTKWDFVKSWPDRNVTQCADIPVERRPDIAAGGLFTVWIWPEHQWPPHLLRRLHVLWPHNDNGPHKSRCPRM